VRRGTERYFVQRGDGICWKPRFVSLIWELPDRIYGIHPSLIVSSSRQVNANETVRFSLLLGFVRLLGLLGGVQRAEKPKDSGGRYRAARTGVSMAHDASGIVAGSVQAVDH
jgi:hypothetical protein